MLVTFRKLRDLLDARERRNAVLLVGLMLIMGLVEAVGVASILPFMAVLSNPEVIRTNRYLAAIYEATGFVDPSSFLIFLAAVAFIVIAGRIALTALTNYALFRYTEMRGFTLSTRLLERYLRQPYAWFLNRHSAAMSKAVLSEVDEVIKGSLISGLNLVSQGMVAIFIIALVVVVEPLVAVTATVLMGGAYCIIYFTLRRYLGKLGRERFRANQQRFQLAQEALAGIKEVKVGGLEQAYLRRFSQVAHRLARYKAKHPVIKEMPRHFLDALAIGGIIIIILVLLINAKDNLSRVTPVLALYAFAGLRLLPAMQRVYSNFATLRFGDAALGALHADMMDKKTSTAVVTAGERKPLALRQNLELREISFTYPNAERPTLVGLSLTIAAKTTVGFVGSTGAGKTTAVDVILGLLQPQKGEVWVDDVRITADNVRNWQQSIGYVPQHIFLADETVAANIAFGVPPDKIDMQAVEQAACMAELHNFIMNELPQGYQTEVGERGVRLSGGQRQRIGIARALYHDPDVLALDEATSALDTVTERAVMDAVRNLASRKTILIIAHRLTTLRRCDQLFLLERGRLRAYGAYDDLLNTDQEFRQMAL